jgi:hypothetical protein
LDVLHHALRVPLVPCPLFQHMHREKRTGARRRGASGLGEAMLHQGAWKARVHLEATRASTE